MKILVVLCFIALASATNTEVFLWDCNGVATLFADNPLFVWKFGLTDLIDSYNLANTLLYERLKCKCPDVTEEEYRSRFSLSSMEFWLAFLTGYTNVPSCALNAPEWDQNYQFVSAGFGNILFDLKGCNYDMFKATGDCYIMMELPSYEMTFQLALSQCSNSFAPFVSVTCSGNGCQKIGLPCLSDSECSSSQKCFKVGNTTEQLIFETFRSLLIYDLNDQSPGCYSTTSMVEEFLSYVRNTIYGQTSAFKFNTNTPSLDISLCVPDVTIDPFGCSIITSANNESVYSCASISDWDGKLPDGSLATSQSRLTGQIAGPKLDTVPTLTDSVPLFYHSPDNGFIFFPTGASGALAGLLTTYSNFFVTNTTVLTNVVTSSVFGFGAMTNFQIKLPLLNNVVNQWFPRNFKAQQCRATGRGGSISEEEYKIRFGWMLPAGLNLLTNSHRTFSSPPMSDWFSTVSLQKLQVPVTCTYSNYLETKTCAFSFTGFQSLINSDITINVLMKDCPDWDFPAIYGECEGKDCELFDKPQPCSSDADCSSFPGSKCLSVTNPSGYDFVQTFFTHQQNSIDTCAGSNKLLTDIQAIISHYTTAKVTDKLCFFDFMHLTTNVTQWTQDQFLIDADTITIKDLGPWYPASTEIPGTVSVTGSSSIIYNSWIVMLLMIFCTWKFQ